MRSMTSLHGASLRSLYASIDLPRFDPGWVWLIGAGPGDPGLLTLHGLNALEQADVVVHDALVDASILALAPPHAQRIFAGKRGGEPSIKQKALSRSLIDLAHGGRRVLRLKGGDPFMFGRGGEEALALAAARVPFRVYGGVSAGLGGLAHAGVAVTHRDVNHVVTFLTGHGSGDGPPDIDWRAVAQGSPTLVLYMAISHLDVIAARLIAAGRDPDDAVAVVVNATLPDQNILETRLADAARDVRKAGLRPPAVIVVGASARLRKGLDWLGAMLGERVLDPDPLAAPDPTLPSEPKPPNLLKNGRSQRPPCRPKPAQEPDRRLSPSPAARRREAMNQGKT